MTHIKKLINKQLLNYLAIFVIALVLAFGVKTIWADWTAPPPPGPPSCDPALHEGCSTPINVGSVEQTKAGNLGVNNLRLGPGDVNDVGTIRGRDGAGLFIYGNDAKTDQILLDSPVKVSGTHNLIVEGGNVGIGTTSPTSTLDVAGAIAITASTPSVFISDSPNAAEDILLNNVPDPYGDVGLFGRFDAAGDPAYLIGSYESGSGAFHGLKLGANSSYSGEVGLFWDYATSTISLEVGGGTGMYWYDGGLQFYGFGDVTAYLGSMSGSGANLPSNVYYYLSLGADQSLRFSPGNADDWTAANDFHIYRDSLDVDKLQFTFGPTSIMALTGTGNLGIGTEGPNEKLVVQDGNIVLGNLSGGGDKRLFLTSSRGEHYITANNWWTEFVSHDNEGWRFKDSGGVTTMEIDARGPITIPSLANCTGASTIDTNAAGDLICGTDDSGAGAGLWTDAGTYIYPNNASGFKLFDANGGIALPGADVALITRGFDAFDAGTRHEGHGRWGLFMEPSILIAGIPNAVGKSFAISRYDANGARYDILRALSNGNVALGNFDPTIRLTIGDNDTGLQWISDGNLAVYTNSAERMRIDSAGNVGIGTPGPDTKLDVHGSAAIGGDIGFTDVYATRLWVGQGNIYVYGNEALNQGGFGRLRLGNAWNYAGIYSDTSTTGATNDLILAASSNRVRIGSDGGGQNLYVSGNIFGGGTLTLGRAEGSTDDRLIIYDGRLKFVSGGSGDDWSRFTLERPYNTWTMAITPSNELRWDHNGTERMKITTGGEIRGATYGFGGMFDRTSAGGCNTTNPFTGGCSCPAGFTEQAISAYTNWADGQNHIGYYCRK